MLLTMVEEYDVWLRAHWAEAKALQRPLPLPMPMPSLRIVTTGAKDDAGPDPRTRAGPARSPVAAL